MTEATATRPGRLPTLTALRFVAAFLVFVYHIHYLGVFSNTSVQESYDFITNSAGGIGVSFFFVLSGFVLTWGARPDDTMAGFWRRRFFKIFPSHAVVWLVIVAMLVASGTTTKAGPAVANLFLVNAWVPHMDNLVFAVNGVTWSLSAEIAFYLLFPFLILGIKNIRANQLWYWAVGVAALALSVPLLSKTFLPGTPMFPGYDQFSWPQMWFAYQFPLVRCLEFIVGILFARIVLSGRWVRIGPGPAALGVVAVYVASLWLPQLWAFAAPYSFPLGLLLSAAAASDCAGRGTLLARRPLVRLGEISFAFFLIHLNVLNSAQAAFRGQWMGYGVFDRTSWSTPVAVLFLLGCLTVSIALAWLLYRFVEVPVMRRWAGPRPRRPVPVVDTDEVNAPTTTG
ncbi:acyltransferase family protein [Streptomyces sp. NRRL B-1677]|uniref:acyltransferase family protein n=1 Tax=Streptomyces sp. NRRL B-1677 TaxID=2682966 RepID=UPI001892A2A7|nr:acyltransferase [Streptomyces sp. NRRL B-1677]MBF6049176.1 acyltransferase family protein [Streptomyces sp. NRRL B-1677]